MSIETVRGLNEEAGHDSDPRYFARQLSDLDFNDRLLDLVADEDVPLLERVKFLVLFSERIDEFFQVQVAGLRRQVVAGIKSLALNGSTPDKLLRDVRASLERMVRRQEALLLESWGRPSSAEGIELCDWDALDEADRSYLHEVFDRLILPVVTPLTVDPSHPVPLHLQSLPQCRGRGPQPHRRHLPLRPGQGATQRRPAAAAPRRRAVHPPRADPGGVHRRTVPGYGRRRARASSGSPGTPTWPSMTTPPMICSSPSRRSFVAAASSPSSGSRSIRGPRRGRWSV